MSEVEQAAPGPSTPESGAASEPLIVSLRQQGRGPGDAVRLHFLETLARKAQAQREPVRQVLEARLAVALEAFRNRPRPAAEADRDRLAAASEPGPMAELLDHFRQQAARDLEGDITGDPGELRSLRQFRDTWARLSIDQTMTRALEAGPSNAGPLNSHALVLQALSWMRDASPAYLGRFMTYIDALLWLDQANGRAAPPKKPVGRVEARRKGRP